MLIVLMVPHCLIHLVMFQRIGIPPNFPINKNNHNKCMAKYQNMTCLKLNTNNITGECVNELLKSYPTLAQRYTVDKFWTDACSNMKYTDGLKCMAYTMPYMENDIKNMRPQQPPTNSKLNASQQLDACRLTITSKDFCVEQFLLFLHCIPDSGHF